MLRAFYVCVCVSVRKEHRKKKKEIDSRVHRYSFIYLLTLLRRAWLRRGHQSNAFFSPPFFFRMNAPLSSNTSANSILPKHCCCYIYIFLVCPFQGCVSGRFLSLSFSLCSSCYCLHLHTSMRKYLRVCAAWKIGCCVPVCFFSFCDLPIYLKHFVCYFFFKIDIYSTISFSSVFSVFMCVFPLLAVRMVFCGCQKFAASPRSHAFFSNKGRDFCVCRRSITELLLRNGCD